MRQVNWKYPAGKGKCACSNTCSGSYCFSTFWITNNVKSCCCLLDPWERVRDFSLDQNTNRTFGVFYNQTQVQKVKSVNLLQTQSSPAVLLTACWSFSVCSMVVWLAAATIGCLSSSSGWKHVKWSFSLVWHILHVVWLWSRFCFPSTSQKPNCFHPLAFTAEAAGLMSQSCVRCVHVIICTSELQSSVKLYVIN